MSEQVQPEASEMPLSEPPLQAVLGATAGAMLRRARESAGLHIGVLAVSLKVPVKKLEALESDRLDLLPDAVFARALAASVCRTLKLDPAPVLAQLPPMVKPQFDQGDDSLNTPFRAPGEGRSLAWSHHLAKPAVVIVLLLLVGALALSMWPVAEKAIRIVASPGVAVPVELGPASAPGADTVQKLTTSPMVVEPIVTPALPTMPVVPTIQVSAAAEPAVPAPSVAESTSGILVLKTRASSWVRVTDARGVIQLSKTMDAGETVAVSGALPLQAVIGKADSTEVQVRGTSLDLTRLSKDNVARFEVK